MDETVQQRLWDSVQYQDIDDLDAALKEGADVNYQYVCTSFIETSSNTSQHNNTS
jgi:hypothetical protein